MSNSLEDILEILAIMEEALDGDGSTSTMPDVTPGQAARWIFGALNNKGYTIRKKEATHDHPFPPRP